MCYAENPASTIRPYKKTVGNIFEDIEPVRHI